MGGNLYNTKKVYAKQSSETQHFVPTTLVGGASIANLFKTQITGNGTLSKRLSLKLNYAAKCAAYKRNFKKSSKIATTIGLMNRAFKKRDS